MRRYIITGDMDNARLNYGAIASQIARVDAEAEHPHRGAWIVRTTLNAQELRAMLLPFFDFSDRLFICETGEDAARFNALQKPGERNVIKFDERRRSSMLSSVFQQPGRNSRMLKAATSGNSR